MVRLTFFQTIAIVIGILFTFGGGLATFFSQMQGGREAAAQQYGDLKREVDDQKESIRDINVREDQFVASVNAQLGQIGAQLREIEVNVGKLSVRDGKR